MRILHVTPYMHPAAGGPPVVVDHLSRELAARGHELRVLTTDLFAGGDDAWPNGQQRPYAMEVFSSVAGNGYGFSTSFWKAIRRCVRNCDIVHIHTLWTFASLAASRACIDAKTPFLVMPHGMLDPHSMRRGRLKKQWYGRLLEWPLLRRARGICYTHPEEERLAALTCLRLPSGHIVELGAELPVECPRCELREEFLTRHPELAGRRVVLSLGRLHAKKGLNILIPAFEEVQRRRPDTHLLIVGPGEQGYVQSIRADIAKRGLGNQITITGPLYGRDKWAAMAASDLFVLPSYQENFAISVVEAIRSGLPIVLSRRVNLWKDIVEAGAGRDCELNAVSLAKTLGDCLADSDWRQTAALAGERLLDHRFSWRLTAERLETIYEKCRSAS
jgi:glycosyltransferase involved in cell wall biosynthesis